MEKYVFDIILGVIAIIIIVISAKKGFALSLLNTVSVVLSAFLSYKFTKPLSEFIYSSFLYDKIELKLTEVLSGLGQDISYDDKLDALLGALPQGLINVSQGFGFNLENKKEILQPIDFNNDAVVKLFIDNIASDIIQSVLEVVVMIVLFFVLSFVLKNISLLFNKLVKKIPVVGKTNTVLGGVLGLIKAVVSVVLICLVVSTVVFALDIPKLRDIVSQSFVYQYITADTFFNYFWL